MYREKTITDLFIGKLSSNSSALHDESMLIKTNEEIRHSIIVSKINIPSTIPPKSGILIPAGSIFLSENLS